MSATPAQLCMQLIYALSAATPEEVSQAIEVAGEIMIDGANTDKTRAVAARVRNFLRRLPK